MDKNMERLVSILSKNGFCVKEFNNIEDVKTYLLEKINIKESVAIGGSMTIDDMNIYEELKQRGTNVYWHWKVENKKLELEKAKTADVYLTSTNAITLDGKLVNMDGNGNRVTSMIYGHERVYVIVGKNKIVRDYKEARERIKNIAAPLNAKRLKIDTPCRFTGKCSDCDSKDRICNIETILHKNPGNTQIYVYLVNEELGY